MEQHGPGGYRALLDLESEPLPPGVSSGAPDRRDGSVYAVTRDLSLALNVALVTGRPLLLRGPPGSGKSTFASFVARKLNWRYYEHVMTSATTAQDLLWRVDYVRRLADAQIGPAELKPEAAYIEPGILWWAIDPESARRRGAADVAPDLFEPFAEGNATRGPDAAVVLIDDVDRADPDVPATLLDPIAAGGFFVPEAGVSVRSRDGVPAEGGWARLLVVLTTNDERALSGALLRRCIVHSLPYPDVSQLVAIAQLHFGAAGAAATHELAERVVRLREEAYLSAVRPPSTAEYLDAVRACLQLGIDATSEVWPLLQRITLAKQADEDLYP